MTRFAVLGDGLAPDGERHRHRLSVEATSARQAIDLFCTHVHGLGQTPRATMAAPVDALTEEQRATLTPLPCPASDAGAE